MSATPTPNNDTVDKASGVPAPSVTNNPVYATFTPSPLSLPQNTSPLLSSTPATVTKALSQAYPFIIAADYILGLLTWTTNDPWQSFLLVAVWTTSVLYFEAFTVYLGHFCAVSIVAAYIWFLDLVERKQEAESSLDAIVHTLNNVTVRLNILLLPLSSLNLSNHELSRFLFTTLFMSPVYILLSYFVFGPRTILLILGVTALTYHSTWARVTRAVMWRSRTVKLITFYLTGLDFSGVKRRRISEAQRSRMNSMGIHTKEGKPVKFTYVLYENQRRWLGIGWTSNLLAYERSSWTDEFLNESSPPESFKLPDADGTGMEWRWVDSTWKLDITNDGALVVNGNKSTTTADPRPNDGFIYYDNTWKNPSSTGDTFSSYTRRRRWIRTAELVNASDQLNVPTDSSVPTTAAASGSSLAPETITKAPGTTALTDANGTGEIKQRKTLRFDEN